MSLTLIVPPAIEPVSLYEMKLQCGLSPFEDTDQLREQTLADDLRASIVAARQDCENLTGRAFITQTWQMTLSRFPRSGDEYQIHDRFDIPIPLPKFGKLVSFTFVDETQTVQDMMTTGGWGYQLVQGGDFQPARLRPPVLRSWPVTYFDQADAVVIQFTCGYGDTIGSVPLAIRNAIKVNAKWMYEGCRGDQPKAVRSLLNSYMNTIA